MTPMKWFYGFLKKYRKLMISGLFLTTIIAALSIGNPYISGIMVDEVIQGGNYALLPRLIACLVGITLLNCVLRFLYQLMFPGSSEGSLLADTVVLPMGLQFSSETPEFPVTKPPTKIYMWRDQWLNLHM